METLETEPARSITMLTKKFKSYCYKMSFSSSPNTKSGKECLYRLKLCQICLRARSVLVTIQIRARARRTCRSPIYFTGPRLFFNIPYLNNCTGIHRAEHLQSGWTPGNFVNFVLARENVANHQRLGITNHASCIYRTCHISPVR